LIWSAKLSAILAAALGTASAQAASEGSCRAQSGAQAPQVVELFTSEGCSSCPPADRWLSTLKGRSDVVPLSFHVTYWDRLGWPDRFASPEFTARQHAAAQRAGSAQVYTPQVLVNGRDWRIWPKLPASASAPQATQAPQVELQREADKVWATVAPLAGRAALSGYFAVVEDGHQTAVQAGENAGQNLRHDHVVRVLRPVPGWSADKGTRVSLSVLPGQPGFPRRTVFVVQEADTQKPLQAVSLAC